jgi:hypothetical protein
METAAAREVDVLGIAETVVANHDEQERQGRGLHMETAAAREVEVRGVAGNRRR